MQAEVITEVEVGWLHRQAVGMWPMEPWKGETQVQDLFLLLFASLWLVTLLAVYLHNWPNSSSKVT